MFKDKMRLTSSRVYTRPAAVPKMPSGLVELMEGLARDVLKNNPSDVYAFCANHMEKLLEIRDGPAVNKPVSLDRKILKAQEKVRQRARERQERFDRDIKLQSEHHEETTTTHVSSDIALTENDSVLPNLKAPVHHDQDLEHASEVEISHVLQGSKALLTEISDRPNAELNIVEGNENKGNDLDGPKNYNDSLTIIESEDAPISLVIKTEAVDFEPLKGSETLGIDENQTDTRIQSTASFDLKFDHENAAIRPELTTENKLNVPVLESISKKMKSDSNIDANNDKLNEHIFTTPEIRNSSENVIQSKAEDLVQCELDPVQNKSKDLLEGKDEDLGQSKSEDLIQSKSTDTVSLTVPSNDSTEKESLILISSVTTLENIVVDDFKLDPIKTISEHLDQSNPEYLTEGNPEDLNQITTKGLDQSNSEELNQRNPEDNIIYQSKPKDLSESKPENLSQSKPKDLDHSKSTHPVGSDVPALPSNINTRNESQISKSSVTAVDNITCDPVTSENNHNKVNPNGDSTERIPIIEIQESDSLTPEITAITNIPISKNITEDAPSTVSQQVSRILTIATVSNNNKVNLEIPDEPNNRNPRDDLNIEGSDSETKRDEIHEPRTTLSDVNNLILSANEAAKEKFVTETKPSVETESQENITNHPEINNIDSNKTAKSDLAIQPEEVSFKEETTEEHFEEEKHHSNGTDKLLHKSDSAENTNEDSLSILDSDLSRTDDDSTQNNPNNMDLETAAITIQKVFRSFMFKSRNSTYEDNTNDEHNSIDEDNNKKEEYYAAANLNMEKRPLGITRKDTVLQTVNEEKSLSLSTDDSSTLSSAATTIQAHVRGFLVRSRLNSSKTFSMNSLVNSHEGPDNDIEQQKNKTILNIHIVPEEGNYLSRDGSLITSMDLSFDGSPPSSVNLHPLSQDISERRKMLKREDAIQSVSPPSNNSGKLSEESVKEVLDNENGVTERELTDADKTIETNNQSNERNVEDSDIVTSASSITPTTIITISKSEELLGSPREYSLGDLQRNGLSLTKMSSDESDVITPLGPSPRSSDNETKLIHSGEFHDGVLPTKVSRYDTSVVREFKTALVYFLFWNDS